MGFYASYMLQLFTIIAIAVISITIIFITMDI
jgi:hypothetical protein